MGKAAAALVVLATALLVTTAGSAATRGVSRLPVVRQHREDVHGRLRHGLAAGERRSTGRRGGRDDRRPPAGDRRARRRVLERHVRGEDVGERVGRRRREVGAYLDRADRGGRDIRARPLAATRTQAAFSRFRRHHAGGGNGAGAGADPQPEPDDLGSEQWDKMRMNVSLTGSYAINRGRPQVRVAFTDTGVDMTHPDIQANLDVADSASFVTDTVLPDGTPIVAEPTIQDFNGHGTWTASAVAAPINGVGISGVAPNVSIVELKTQDANGNGLLLWFDQALLYAAAKHVDIVSSSIVAYTQKCSHGDEDTAAGLRRRRLRPRAPRGEVRARQRRAHDRRDGQRQPRSLQRQGVERRLRRPGCRRGAGRAAGRRRRLGNGLRQREDVLLELRAGRRRRRCTRRQSAPPDTARLLFLRRRPRRRVVEHGDRRPRHSGRSTTSARRGRASTRACTARRWRRRTLQAWRR